MKTLSLWTIILTIFICLCATLTLESCNSDNDGISADAHLHAYNNPAYAAVFRKTGVYPENSANEYDAAGQLHNEIADIYLNTGQVSASTSGTIQQVESIANAIAEFQLLKPSNYVSPTAGRIDYIIANPQVSTLEIIANSAMSLKGKLSLTAFLDKVMLYKSQDAAYDTMYQYIISYETGVLGDNLYTAADRKVILTTSSIARYAFYLASKRKKRPRDRDWDISWGNLMAGTEGSGESTAKAIVMATVTGIVVNK